MTVFALRTASTAPTRPRLGAAMGPSGVGGSVPLNLADGLDSPASGQVLVDGTGSRSLSRKQLPAWYTQNTGFSPAGPSGCWVRPSSSIPPSRQSGTNRLRG